MYFETEIRGYWKVTRRDLEEASLDRYQGIIFHINGTGARWQGGRGKIVINKGSAEWTYLIHHIANLNSFVSDHENTNSVNVPRELRGCFIEER